MLGRVAALVIGAVVLAACSQGDGRDMVEGVGTLPDAPAATTSEAPSPPTVSEAPSLPTVSEAPSLQTPAPVPTDSDETPGTELAGPVQPVGFDAVAATITSAQGEVCDVCLWLAAEPSQRAQGLMGVTDLGVGDGMVFRYDTPTSTSFWMKNTPMPLTIAFFDSDGVHLDTFDMEPCVTDSCRRYATPPEFVAAIEFPQGTLDDFEVGPGSTLEVSALPCLAP